MSDQKLLIKLLELEVEALRSVLSELDVGSDLTCYTQWQKAQAIADVRDHLKAGQ